MILVTGGTGLLGSHLLYQLCIENHHIRAIYRTNSDLKAVKKVFSYYNEDFKNLFNKIEWIESDIIDVYSLESAFENVLYVYHLAALVSFDPKDYKQMRKINIEGTANIVNFCIAKSVRKLCYVSSIATLEKQLNGNKIDEQEEWNSRNYKTGYSITKYGSEMEVWRASQEGVDTVIVNPGIILGPGFWKSGSGSIFGKIHQGLKFYSEGITGFVSVEDVVQIMRILMKSKVKNERFVLVSENLSFKNVFFQIADNFKKKRPSIKVTSFMSAIGWRLEYLKSLLTGKTPLLTKHSAKSIHNASLFSAEKIKREINIEFEPIGTTIKKVCALFESTN